MGFFSVLRKSRHPLPLPSALFPTKEYTASVSAWASSIGDMAGNEECRLHRIVHCKVKSGLREEFLLIYIRHPSGKTAIVLADRDTSFHPSSADTEEDKPPPYSQMEARALGIAQNSDRIRLSSDHSKTSLTRNILNGWAEIHTVKFPKASEAPSVAHLAVLLTVVHQHVMSPGASAELRSGWFAYCVGEVMREVFIGKPQANKKWVRAPYGGMKVEGRDTVDVLIREFTPAWEGFLRRQVVRGDGRSTERARSKRPQENATRVQMDSFADMLRTMS